MSVSGLKPANKKLNDKEENLVQASSKRSMTLSNDRPGVISINIT